jgi:hypothetical protein
MEGFRKRWIYIAVASLAFEASLSSAGDRQLESNYADFPAGALLHALASRDERIHDRANMYLLGVFDATEGTVWCDYSVLKTSSLRSHVYGALKRRIVERPDERAAVAVAAILHDLSPCGGNP